MRLPGTSPGASWWRSQSRAVRRVAGCIAFSVNIAALLLLILGHVSFFERRLLQVGVTAMVFTYLRLAAPGYFKRKEGGRTSNPTDEAETEDK